MFSILKNKLFKKYNANINISRLKSIDKDIINLNKSFDDLISITREVALQAAETSEALMHKLEISQNRLDTTVDNINEIIIIKTVNNSWIYANNALCEFFKLDKNKIINKTTEDVIKIYPQLKDIIDKINVVEEHIDSEFKPQKFKLVKNNKVLNLIITPIKTKDTSIKEIVLVGHILRE